MSERSKPRKPATFRLDDPGVVVIDAGRTARPARGTVQVTPEADPRCCRYRSKRRCCQPRGFRWGAVFWTRRRRTGAARARAQRRQSDRGSVRAQREPGLRRDWPSPSPPRWRLAVVSRARSVRTGAACGDRKTACARSRVLVERRPRGEPGHRAGAPEARAPESATGARPRHAAGPCRRHHRRRRHDQAGRARTDDAARSGGAAAGLFRRPTRLDRHRGQPARVDRRAVRVRGLAAADPAIGAALWRTAGRARHDPRCCATSSPISPSPAAWRRATAWCSRCSATASRQNCRSGSAKAC